MPCLHRGRDVVFCAGKCDVSAGITTQAAHLLLLHVVLAIALYWIALGSIGLVVRIGRRALARLFFPLGALGGLALAICAYPALSAAPQSLVLPLGLPDLPFHLRLDPLAAYFLLLLGAASAGVSLFSAGYFEKGGGDDIRLICLQYHVFLAAMLMVLVADDAYLFMVAWESMALASYFLVTTDHRVPEIRRAGLLYLIVAHVGAIAILLTYGVLQLGQWSYTFDAMRANTLGPTWAAVAFLLALFGFGAKAGFLPVHIWLPEAHPAAPSPVSALMSGVMLKTAIYGLLRVTFDLLHQQMWWWGVAALIVGLTTAFIGVAFAAVQTDMKRLLAWSSIENIGIILTAIGLAILFHAFQMNLLAALALAAALFHSLNHALFKTLLFLATGSVMHVTHQRSLGKLGGLIRRMPWVGGPCIDRDAGHRGTAAIEWICLGVDAVPGVPADPRIAQLVSEHVRAGRDGCAGPGRRAGGLRDGEVLWHRVSRSAAGGVGRCA